MIRNHDDNSLQNFFKTGKLYRISQRPDTIIYSSSGQRSALHNDAGEDSYVFDRELIEKDTNLEEFGDDDRAPFNEPDDEDESLPGFGNLSRKQGYKINPIHPATDDASNIDTTELYNEGLAGAVEASEPNAGSAVLHYDPTLDLRKMSH